MFMISSKSAHRLLATTLLFRSSLQSSAFLVNVSPRVNPTTTTRMASTTTSLEDLYLQTPLILSDPLSKRVGRDVYLKMDYLQDSGSFKDRGMANLCLTLKTTKQTEKLVGSSGGNAGLALATVGAKLGMTVSVVVPESTKPNVIEKLSKLGADVTIHGAIWNEADLLARQRVDEDPTAEYVSPYDDPLLWAGHASIIDEVSQQLPKEHKDLGAFIVSVGGGGLLCGVLEGLDRNQMTSSPVIAAETEGAASFGASWADQTTTKPVRLETISSIATSLGALEVTEVALERSRKHAAGVQSAICTDEEAVAACLGFAADHRIMVEPACGAGLSILYSERLRNEFLKDIPEGKAVVVEVCGGSGVNLDLLLKWRSEFCEDK